MIRRFSTFLPSTNFKTNPQQLSSLFPIFKLPKLSFSSSSSSSSSFKTHMAATDTTRAYAAAATAPSAIHRRQRMKKLVVVMGATGSGKSKLSIDLATRFFPDSEIINSDKIQVYRGLDITTNKISMHDRRGVPHHFLGEFDPDTEFTPSEFRSLAPKTIAQIISRRNLPLLVGGSNSLIHALLAKKYNPDADVFGEPSSVNSLTSELRYNCCFIWVDVSLPVLNKYLDERVDDMLESGMFDELSEYFAAEGFAESGSMSQTGLRKAIGVPEFESYFKTNGSSWAVTGAAAGSDVDADVAGRVSSYDEAVKEIKDNTCQLAKRQMGKIVRLRDAGWDLHRIDATKAFRAPMRTSESGQRASEIWEKMVVEPSVKIVKRFLME